MTVSVRSVPAVTGIAGLTDRLPVSANAAMMERKRPKSMTTPVAVSHCGLYGPGGDCGSISFRPHVWRRPLSSEPLLEADELNS